MTAILGPLQEVYCQALELQTYPQGYTALCSRLQPTAPWRFCCLGVACCVLDADNRAHGGHGYVSWQEDLHIQGEGYDTYLDHEADIDIRCADGWRNALPPFVMNRLMFHSRYGHFLDNDGMIARVSKGPDGEVVLATAGTMESLTHLNDSMVSFPAMARLIRAHPDYIFCGPA